MAALGRLLRTVEGGCISFWCPGCDEAHTIKVEGERAWGFNADAERPTFTPSVLVRSGHYLHGDTPGNCCCDWHIRMPEVAKGNKWKCIRCHSYVTDGQIEFLADSSHELAGKTVPLPDWPTYAAES